MATVKIIGKVAVKVMPDTTEFKDELRDDLQRIKRQIGDLKIDVVPQITAASKAKVKAEFDKLAASMDGTNVTFDLNLNDASVAATEAALDGLARKRSARVDVDYDREMFAQFASDVGNIISKFSGAAPQIRAFREGLEKLGNLDEVALSVGLVATKIALVTGASIAATGQILSLSGSIAQMAQASLALPGIMGGLAIGLGATAAAFKDFNKYVPQAKKYMSELQDTISKNFWEQAAQPIRKFIDDVFPILNKNLAFTGTALGKFFGSLAGHLGTTLNPALAGMFDKLNESIDIATKHTDSLANIIKILGENGAQFLPRLARWFGDILDSFSNFLTKAQADGSLKQWTRDGIDALTAFGNVLKESGRILHGLFDAARDAGGASLQSLASGLKDIADTVNSDAFKSGLTDTFRAAFDMMDKIANGAGPGLRDLIVSIADTFKSIGPGLGESLGNALGELFSALADPKVGGAIETLFEGINNAIGSMQGSITPLIQALSSFAPVIATMLENIAMIGASGSDQFAKTLQNIAKALTPVLDKLGNTVNNVFNGLMPVFSAVGEAIVKVVNSLGPLIDAFQQLWDLLSPVLVPVLKFIVSIIGDSIVGVFTGLTMVIKGVIKIVQGAIEVFHGIVDVFAGLFTLDFGRVWDGLKQVFGGLGKIILGALEGAAGAIWAWLNGTLVGLFKGAILKLVGPKLAEKAIEPLFSVFEKLGGFVSKALGPVFDFIAEGFKFILTPARNSVTVFEGLWGRLLEVLKYPFQAIKFIVETEFKIVLKIIETVWGLIKGIFDLALRFIDGTIGTFLRQWGSMIVEAFNLYKAIIKGAWDLIWGIIKGALDLIKGTLDSAWSLIKAGVEAVWGGIWAVIDGTWTLIKTGVDTAVNWVKTLLDGVWDLIGGKVTTIWDSIWTKIDNVWTSIKTTVDNAVGKVKEHMSNAWDKIKETLGTAWDAIKTKVGEKLVEVANKVGELPQKAKDALVGIVTVLVDKGKDLIDGVINGIQSKWTDLKTMVSNAPGKALDALTNWAQDGKTLGTLLYDKGKELLQGFLDGINAIIEKIKQAVLDAIQWVKDHLDDIPGAGKLIGKMLGGGSSSKSAGKTAGKAAAKAVADSLSAEPYQIQVEATLTNADALAASIPGLAARINGGIALPTEEAASIHIDNITIPLEDLEQIKTLEEFLNMLRVRSRQGVTR
jgi:phage-related protein